jgi:predicted DNA-binding transcriptional regulator YafY
MDNRSVFTLQVLEILRRYSNEEHYLTQSMIMDYLDKDYGVCVDRKSVGNAIIALDSIYPDLIEKSRDRKKPGVAILERTFSREEVIMMMMAIYSFKGFSSKMTKQLTDKLISDFSLRDQFPSSHTVTNAQKIENPEVVYNFSIISEAIAKMKRITFDYTNGSGKTRKRNVCPHYVFVSKEEFKLLATFTKERAFTIFNLESMTNIQLLEDSNGYHIQDIERYKDFDIDRFTNEHMYWFEKDPITVRLKMRNPTNRTQIIKWFGKQATFLDGDIVEIKNDIDSIYFWLKDYGEYLDVLEPQELKDRLYEYGKKLVETYKKE